MKYKLICYGCGKATSEGYHVLINGTILHYCPDCLEDVEAARHGRMKKYRRSRNSNAITVTPNAE